MKRILVADDDKAILDALSLFLEDSGYLVTTTTRGEEVRTIHDHFPDVILLDIWMSGADGGEICSYLKSKKKTKDIPIILFSANRDTAKIAKETGADDYIEKPFNLEELLEKIEKITNHKVHNMSSASTAHAVASEKFKIRN